MLRHVVNEDSGLRGPSWSIRGRKGGGVVFMGAKNRLPLRNGRDAVVGSEDDVRIMRNEGEDVDW